MIRGMFRRSGALAVASVAALLVLSWVGGLALAQQSTSQLQVPPPVAVADSAMTPEETPVSFNVLTNDTDKLKNNWRESNIKDPKFKESMVFLNELIHKHKAAPNFARGTGEPPGVGRVR